MIDISYFESFPVLCTRRMILRQLNLKDAPRVFIMRSDPQVNKYIGRKSMATPEEARQLISTTLDHFRQKKSISWGAELRTTKTFLGSCGLFEIDHQHSRAEIGGELLPDYWGKRLAIEAVERIVQFGADELNLHRIEAKVSPFNRSTIFMLEALGFKKEAHLRDYYYFDNRFHDLLVYGLLV